MDHGRALFRLRAPNCGTVIMNRQRGVALLTVMMVLATAVALASLMESENVTAMRRSEAWLIAETQLLYARSAENWGSALLLADLLDNNNDHLGEPWAIKTTSPITPGIGVEGKMQDLQGRFNINNLQAISPKAEDTAYAEVFTRLLEELELPVTLIPAILDWLDHDSEARIPFGAEDDYYLSLDPPYRSANRLMTHISELRLVAGIDSGTFDKIRPYISALPTTTPINVNTAPALILQSLHKEITLELAEQLITSRQNEPFAKVEGFLRLDPLAGISIPKVLLSVDSRYFLLDARVRIGERTQHYHSHLVRFSDRIERLMWSQVPD